MPRPTVNRLLVRSFQLKCPRCGRGPLFSGFFKMYDRCLDCNLNYEREPGFYLGSIYINYGVTAMLTTIGYITLRFGFDFDAKPLLYAFTTFCVVFPILFFRYARALWLAMDSYFDQTAFRDDN